MGPLRKFWNGDFIKKACSEDEAHADSRDRFRSAIESVASGKACDGTMDRVRVRDIEMTTVTLANSGFPIQKYFDWFISQSSGADGTIILLGDPVSEQEGSQREKEVELIDFFQNAPIALHWLTGEGNVLWANQTELNVLGYTAEEYIGQPIMKFCPDEQELVLEIFKQLGSGHAIKDVPVRFRTKDGRMVHLLIDSNVKYNSDGSFGHTRCFIRDDTGRKIREARASLLLEETKRSLKMLDNFMAQTLHHLRTPLHVTQTMVDLISDHLTSPNTHMDAQEKQESLWILGLASDQIFSSIRLLDDVSDLGKFDQGVSMRTIPVAVNLPAFGQQVLEEIPTPAPDVNIVLELSPSTTDANADVFVGNAGPSFAEVDPNILKRVLLHLLGNAVTLTVQGTIALRIGYNIEGRLTFVVSDTGPGLEMAPGAAEGDLPTIFQRYHQEHIPEQTTDLEAATNLREKLELHIGEHKRQGLGVGLSLTYHLVQALGGELRCSSTMGKGASFWFSLPQNIQKLMPSFVEVKKSESIKNCLPDVVVLNKPNHVSDDDKSIAMSVDETNPGCMAEIDDSYKNPESMAKSVDSYKDAKSARRGFDYPKDKIPLVLVSSLASVGIKSEVLPSVLVVEDTPSCAKLLCKILSKFGHSSQVAENGKIAIDILQEAPLGTFDLILMDLRMPVMDGFEATAIIKNELKLDIPVVALTGDYTEATREKAKQIGFDGFHGKPLKRDVLKEVINEFTGHEG